MIINFCMVSNSFITSPTSLFPHYIVSCKKYFIVEHKRRNNGTKGQKTPNSLTLLGGPSPITLHHFQTEVSELGSQGLGSPTPSYTIEKRLSPRLPCPGSGTHPPDLESLVLELPPMSVDALKNKKWFPWKNERSTKLAVFLVKVLLRDISMHPLKFLIRDFPKSDVCIIYLQL